MNRFLKGHRYDYYQILRGTIAIGGKRILRHNDLEKQILHECSIQTLASKLVNSLVIPFLFIKKQMEIYLESQGLSL